MANVNAKNPGNRTENASGTLIHDGEWKAQTGYGSFPFSKALQAKMKAANISVVDTKGAKISVTVQYGQVIAYNFIDEGLEA